VASGEPSHPRRPPGGIRSRERVEVEPPVPRDHDYQSSTQDKRSRLGRAPEQKLAESYLRPTWMVRLVRLDLRTVTRTDRRKPSQVA